MVLSARSVFIPMSSVESGDTVYPLQVALWNTPHPEVVALMLDAGADAGKINLEFYLGHPVADGQTIKILVDRIPEDARCGALVALAGAGNMAMMEYTLGLGVSPSCFSSGWMRDFPLRRAFSERKPDAAIYLLEQGAMIPEDADDRMRLLSALVGCGRMDILLHFESLGLKTSETDSKGRNTLMNTASVQRVENEELLVHLARTVPLDEKNREKTLTDACRIRNAKIINVLLQRAGGLPNDTDTVLSLLRKSLMHKNADVFWALVKRGADC